MSEYQRRTAAERSAEAQARAVARGVLPFPNIPPGYRRGDDGVLVVEPTEAKIVAEAFQMRLDGATVAEVRAYLARHGIERSYHGVQELLRSRVVLGEIHFGKLVNLKAHEPIMSPELWAAVQRVRVPRGRRAKSEHLLARLGVLRCGTCGSRMVVGSAHHGQYALYRCPPTRDCKQRVTISAEIVEGLVTDAVRERIADVEGRASAETNIREAEADVDLAQEALDGAIRMLAGLEDEPAARERLIELRGARDAARERLEALGGATAAVTVTGAADWDRLTIAERRDLIRATIARVTVAPGRGADRVAVEFQ